MKKNNRLIRINFDALDFRWSDVPKKKYDNFMKMKDIEADPEKRIVDGYPYILQVEPTNLCNLECPVCPVGSNEMGREKRHMPLKEFKALIDDMEDYLLLLILWEWGEPFMHPELPEMIKYAADRDIKTLTSTNAHFLRNDDYLKRIFRSNLATLIIAIDSLEQDKYAIYRKKGKLSEAVEGLRKVVRLKKSLKSNMRINLRMVIMKQNEHELPDMRRFAKKIGVDVFTVKSLNPSCGSDAMDEELVPTDPKYRRYVYHEGTYERVRIDKHCRKMWLMCNISANGEVIPCGYDYNSELKIGLISEKPLTQIWNSPEAQLLRRRLYYQKETIPKCHKCSINFKLSGGDNFLEVINFDESIITKLLSKCYEYYKQNTVIHRCVNTVPFIKKVGCLIKEACY